MNNKQSCRLSSTCCFVRLNAYTNVYTLLYVEKRVKLNPRTTDCSLSEFILVPRPSNSGSLSVPLIKAVDANSPAQNGRLKQDDRLIGVNGYYVDNKPHLDVVNLIKRGGSSAWLLWLLTAKPMNTFIRK